LPVTERLRAVVEVPLRTGAGRQAGSVKSQNGAQRAGAVRRSRRSHRRCAAAGDAVQAPASAAPGDPQPTRRRGPNAPQGHRSCPSSLRAAVVSCGAGGSAISPDAPSGALGVGQSRRRPRPGPFVDGRFPQKLECRRVGASIRAWRRCPTGPSPPGHRTSPPSRPRRPGRRRDRRPHRPVHTAVVPSPRAFHLEAFHAAGREAKIAASTRLEPLGGVGFFPVVAGRFREANRLELNYAGKLGACANDADLEHRSLCRGGTAPGVQRRPGDRG